MKYFGCIVAGGCKVGGENSGGPSATNRHHTRVLTKPGEKYCFVAVVFLLVVSDNFDEEVRDACCVI